MYKVQLLYVHTIWWHNVLFRLIICFLYDNVSRSRSRSQGKCKIVYVLHTAVSFHTLSAWWWLYIHEVKHAAVKLNETQRTAIFDRWYAYVYILLHFGTWWSARAETRGYWYIKKAYLFWRVFLSNISSQTAKWDFVNSIRNFFLTLCEQMSLYHVNFSPPVTLLSPPPQKHISVKLMILTPSVDSKSLILP